MLPFLIPIALVQFSLMIGAIISIVKKKDSELRFQSKIPWLLIVIFISIFGPLVYFIFGTDDKNNNGGSDDDNYFNK